MILLALKALRGRWTGHFVGHHGLAGRLPYVSTAWWVRPRGLQGLLLSQAPAWDWEDTRESLEVQGFNLGHYVCFIIVGLLDSLDMEE